MTMKRALLVAALASLVLATGASAVTTKADPLTGTWKVQKGGSGTFAITRRGSLLGFIARTTVKLGCVRNTKGGVVGFAELPSQTRLPKGVYSVQLGISGSGCSYAMRLKLNGKTASGRFTYSEDGGLPRPVVFARA
jgi:hypothetical protein